MKRIIAALVICLLVLAGSAYAAENFTRFTMYFKGKNTYDEVVTDTTSKLKSSGTYSRLYLTSNTSSVNCVWMTHDVTAGRTCSNVNYARLTGTSYKAITYTCDVAKNHTVALFGRPDSSVDSCVVTGSFGAG